MDEHLERQYLEVELYEKIVVRERKRKILIISLAFSLFLFLCGIPVYQERLPKWNSLRAAKNIAVEVEKLKTESLRLMKPLQLSVLNDGNLKVEQVLSCTTDATSARIVQEMLYQKKWTNESSDVVLLNEAEAKKINLNLAVSQICFDPVSGISVPKVKKVFAVVPVKDLAESKLDRASYVEITLSSGSISIN